MVKPLKSMENHGNRWIPRRFRERRLQPFKLKLKLMLKGLAKFGGWRISILHLLRRAAAGSLGTYTYPVYVGVTVPIGTTIGGVALLLQIVLRKKWQSVIVYKVYTSISRPPPGGNL